MFSRPHSIRFHIGAIMLCFCVFVFVSLWLVQIVFLEDSYREVKVHTINDSTMHLDAVVRDMNVIEETSLYTLEEQMQELARQSDACILVRSDTAMISANTRMQSCLISSLSPSQLQELTFLIRVNGGQIWSYLNNNELIINTTIQDTFGKLKSKRSSGDKYLIYGKVSNDAYGHEVLVLMSSALDAIEMVQTTLKQTIWRIFWMVLFLSLVITWVMTRWIAKPIANITQQAKKLADGDYTPNFHEKGYVEIAKLNDTLNYACEELSKVEDLRRELIANVSHDLRTPLTLISGYGEMMRDIPSENNAENVQIIIDEANRLSSMVNTLLDVSKLEGSVGKKYPQTFCITSLLRDAQKRYQTFLQAQGYHIHLESLENVYVHADYVQIQQVLFNLMNNAVQYTGKDKQIWIKQTCDKQMVRIDVIDDGDGVEPQQLKDIWNRYYRIDKTHKRAIVGSGLGLSIVKQIVKQHQGACGVESEVGKGSDFFFTLPIVNDEKKKGM